MHSQKDAQLHSALRQMSLAQVGLHPCAHTKSPPPPPPPPRPPPSTPYPKFNTLPVPCSAPVIFELPGFKMAFRCPFQLAPLPTWVSNLLGLAWERKEGAPSSNLLLLERRPRKEVEAKAHTVREQCALPTFRNLAQCQTDPPLATWLERMEPLLWEQGSPAS